MANVAADATDSDVSSTCRHRAVALRDGRLSLHLQAALEPAARRV